MTKNTTMILLTAMALGGCSKDDHRNNKPPGDSDSTELVDTALDDFTWNTDFDTDGKEVPVIDYHPKCYPYRLYSYSAWATFLGEAFYIDETNTATCAHYNDDSMSSAEAEPRQLTHSFNYEDRTFGLRMSVEFYNENEQPIPDFSTISPITANEQRVVLAKGKKKGEHRYHALFIRPDGTHHVLFDDDFESQPSDINNAGAIVGNLTLEIKDPVTPPFVWDEHSAYLWKDAVSAVVDLGTLGGTQTRALGMNNSNDVVGSSQDIADEWKPFVWNEISGFQELETLGGVEGAAYEISDSGMIVGEAQDAGGVTMPVYWDGTEPSSLGLLTSEPMKSGVARGLNSHREIVGWDVPAAKFADSLAWVWQNGEKKDLTSLINPHSRHRIVHAYDINDNGLIVGTAYMADIGPLAVVLIPQSCPEGEM